jgi:ferritin-like metal-binding protein YciE
MDAWLRIVRSLAMHRRTTRWAQRMISSKEGTCRPSPRYPPGPQSPGIEPRCGNLGSLDSSRQTSLTLLARVQQVPPRGAGFRTEIGAVCDPRNTVMEIIQMAHSETLKDVYADEMKDLWSANDQMTKAVKAMSAKAHDPKLKEALEESILGIEKYAKTLKSLIADARAEVEREYCKGMKGLVKEANKHIGPHAPQASALLDIVIISQYQRMSHYGLAGFGAAAAYAKALGMKDHYERLSKIVSEIYAGDEYASRRPKKLEKYAAQSAKVA